MSSDIAIKVENLSKCYEVYEQPRDRLKQFLLPKLQRALGLQQKQYFKEFWALRDITFEVKKGETVGVIGRNGSGKSTLLQMICGTLNPTSGSISTQGRIAALLELGSGFNPEFTGRENVYLNGAVLGLNYEEINQRFEAIALFAEIGKFMDRPVKTYSSGMMMRLAFAVSVCVDPDILIVDEALSVGDAAFQFKCQERMNCLTESGATLLFVSHDISMVKSFCDRAIYIEDGLQKLQGDTALVAETYIMDINKIQIKQNIDNENFQKININNGPLPAFGVESGRILSAGFLPNGNSNSGVIYGDKITLSVSVEYVCSLPHPTLSIFLMDRRMIEIGGKSFPLNSNEIKGGIVHAVINVEFEAKLRPDHYQITLKLESRRPGSSVFKLIEKQAAALSFHVFSGELDFLGTFDIGMMRY